MHHLRYVSLLLLLALAACGAEEQPVPVDTDGDGVADTEDICPSEPDPLQLDEDGDGQGDLCDPCPTLLDGDDDGDAICDSSDNCRERSNVDQADRDADGIGDVCDLCPWDPANDQDDDGHCAQEDNCVDQANPDQSDLDEDQLGDLCDEDRDGDDVVDFLCSESCQWSGDGVCDDGGPGAEFDACELGSDCTDCGGRPADNCVSTVNEDQIDSDEDGFGDVCDGCPLDSEDDADGDGVCGDLDNCPEMANPEQADSVGDGVGDACRHVHDFDSDGVVDTEDSCPYDPNPAYSIESVAYGPVEAPTTALIFEGEDQSLEAIALGFEFPFFGQVFEEVFISANGLLAFGQPLGNGQAHAKTIPTAGGVDNFIAPYWVDLDPRSEGGSVLVGTQGEVGERVFTLQFANVEHHRDDSDYGRVSFSVELYETSGVIEVVCDRCVPFNDGDTIAQGLEGPGGLAGVTDPARNLVSTILLEDSVRFVPGVQLDTDGDGLGDVCDPDQDEDGIANEEDNCPLSVNADQLDTDDDGIGDACNDVSDADGDEWHDGVDNCPASPNGDQLDTDEDGFGDACSRLVVSGTIQYEDRLYGVDGFTGELAMAAVSWIAVEVVRSEDGRVMGEGQADGDGAFRVELERPVGEHYVRALSVSPSESRSVMVRDRSVSRALYSVVSETFELDEQEEVSVALVASAETAVGGALNTIDSALRGYDLIRRHTDSLAPTLVYRWQPLMKFDCGSCYGGNVISLGGQVADPDEYDDDIILHEFGHYFSHHFSRDSSPGGSHNGDKTEPTLAYGEGLATFFSSMVKVEPIYIDNYDDSHKYKNLETATEDEEEYFGTAEDALDGDVSEYLVAAVLWDSLDGANEEEAHDQLELGEAGVMQILLETIDDPEGIDMGYEGVDLADWFNAMACLETELQGAIDAVAEERVFPWQSETDSVCSEKSMLSETLYVKPRNNSLLVRGATLVEHGPTTLVVRLSREGKRHRWHWRCEDNPCHVTVPEHALGSWSSATVSVGDQEGVARGGWAGDVAQKAALGGRVGPYSKHGAVREYSSR